MVFILKSKQEQRKLHWSDIKNRVTTHEGEFLHGKKGRKYQSKWSKSYLGKDMSGQTNFDAPQYQKELEKGR